MPFSITRAKGFHITLDNGWTLSVQFGWANYCKNYSVDKRSTPHSNLSCADAEIALWHGDGSLLPIDDGSTICGNVSPDTVARILHAMQTEPDVLAAVQKIIGATAPDTRS